MGTNQTTKETRRASYDAVIPKAKERSRLILETLGSRSMTVSEITDELVKAGRIPYYNRNYVAPRLSELKDMGVVETCGLDAPHTPRPPKRYGAGRSFLND